MGEVAQAQARQYSWDRSMEALFGSIYRTAFVRSSQRLASAPQAVRQLVPAE
jgi:hypothetical protein